jgi:hypothetical protein
MNCLSRFFPVLVLVACSPASSSSASSPSSATVSGTVAGASLAAVSAVARYATIGTNSVNGQTTEIRGLRILVSNKANTCAEQHFASSTLVELTIRGDQVAPGTYTVIDPIKRVTEAGQAYADFNAVDGSCKGGVAQSSTSGTLVIQRSEGRVQGTVDINFAGGHLGGSFDADLCPDAPADGGVPACTD